MDNGWSEEIRSQNNPLVFDKLARTGQIFTVPRYKVRIMGLNFKKTERGIHWEVNVTKFLNLPFIHIWITLLI